MGNSSASLLAGNLPGTAQFNLVRSVFRNITSEDWFVVDPRQRQKFGTEVILAFQSGLVDEFDLHAHCLQIAREKYALSRVN